MTQPPAGISIMVLVDPERFDTAVRALADAGVLVGEQNRAIGTVGGQVDLEHFAGVAALDGVLAVERDRTIQLPPPDSEVQ